MVDTNETESRAGLVGYWLNKLRREEKAHKPFREAAEAACAAYYDERKDSLKNLYPLFWSNVQTLHSALYQQTPKPDVRRRYDFGGMEGQIAKEAAKVVERGLSYALDTTDFSPAAHRIVDDFLITGLGVPWVEYDAKVARDQDGEPVQIELQTVKMTLKPWDRFHWEPCQDWNDCDWVATDDYLTAAELKKKFNVEPQGAGSANSKLDSRKDQDKYAATFRVVTIWYKPRRMVYVICEDVDEPLEVRKDALNLSGFFPCPPPLMSNVKSGDCSPRPDYLYYAYQCDYINRLTNRINKLTSQIKAAGFYDAQLGELDQLSSVEDGAFVPIQNLAERLQTAGGAAAFDRVMANLPIEDKARVLTVMLDVRDRVKAEVYEITGISDIVRGVTVASETATAQQTKAQWAQIRIARRRADLNEALRGVFRIMAEIMAEHFTPETWFLVSGMRVPPQVLAAIKTDVGRNLLIDVETDSTIAADDAAEKEQRNEMVNVMTPLLERLLPTISQGIMPADLGKELLITLASGYKHGKSLEDVLNQLPGTQQQMAQLQQQLQQAQQQLQQAGMQMQQMQQQAMQAVQAEKARADKAEAQLAQGEQVQAQADIAKTGAEIQKIGAETARIQAQTVATLRPQPMQGAM